SCVFHATFQFLFSKVICFKKYFFLICIFLTFVCGSEFLNVKSSVDSSQQCDSKSNSTTFSNSTIESAQKSNENRNILKAYESSFPNDTLRQYHDDNAHPLRLSRSLEAKLGTLKHHVFILKPYRGSKYRAYCAGSIITIWRVITSAECFYTNRKKLRHDLSKLRLVAGLLVTVQDSFGAPKEQQWKSPTHVFSQKFYRVPAFSLAIVQVDTAWEFNQFVDKIPFATQTLDYDGVCTGTVVKITKSWALKKYLFTEQRKIIPRQRCERMLLRTCRLYICTIAEGVTAESDIVGGGLVCFDTGAKEEHPTEGILVGVTVLINIGNLPSLNHRIAMFNRWVIDGATPPITLSPSILTLWFIKFLT
ncbi:uncharacterized protein LOC128671937, partial [Plodia interpunctella]|uniref:uncharacterized protein LOC128671937 n=1 Tax=Plodia interpunctella TaxID=58824 RepID=UPI0023678D01